MSPAKDDYSLGALIRNVCNPKTRMLSLGIDISKVNIDLNDKERIYQTYPGPFNEKKLKHDEIDYPVPQDYLFNNDLKSKLPNIKSSIKMYSEELLFFFFYWFAGEQMQLMAVRELCNREWRFHKDEQLWFFKVEEGKNKLYSMAIEEHGIYIYFDPVVWTKAKKKMTIVYDRLESPPWHSPSTESI